MKKTALIVIPMLLAVITLSAVGGNRLRSKEAVVERSWKALMGAYRERAQVLPGYVRLVASSAGYEQPAVREITAAVISVRQKWSGQSAVSARSVRDVHAAEAELTRALAQLVVIQARYPRLAANPEFVALSRQLEAIEDRINDAWSDYNRAAHDFNLSKRAFPGSLADLLFLHTSDRIFFTSGEGASIAVADAN